MIKKTTKTEKQAFKATKKGLIQTRPKSKKHRVADFIRVSGLGKNIASGLWFVQIKYEDIDGKRSELVTQRSNINKPRIIKDILLDSGYTFPNSREECDLVLEYLATTTPKRKIEITAKTGWVDKHYVFPDRILGPNALDIMYLPHPDAPSVDTSCSGSIEDWQKNIGQLAMHSTRMVFSICVSLGSAVIEMTNVESGTFNLMGESSKGKTTALRAAQSIFSCAGQGDLPTWDITGVGLDEIAALHSDRILILDELGRASSDGKTKLKAIRDAAYKITGGTGRIRSRFSGNNGNSTKWRTMILSTSEDALSELAHSNGHERPLGEQTRLIDIPAIVSDEYGIFESIPDDMNSIQLAEDIGVACGAHYGTAGRHYVSYLVENYDEVSGRVAILVDEFMDYAKVPIKGWDHRFAKRFALAYAAGVIGIESGLLPWQEGDVKKAILSCYLDARATVPDFKHLISNALNDIRKKMRRRTLFRDLRKKANNNKRPSLTKARGFIKQDVRHGVFYVIKSNAFKKWAVKHLPYSLVSKHLREEGYLVTTSRNLPTKQISISGIKEKRRYYCIKKSFLDD